MRRPTPPELLTDDIEVIIPISKRDEDKRLVFGWMYLPTNKGGRIIVDKHDDFMLPEDLEETAYRYVDTSRTGGVMHLRESHVQKSEDKPYGVMSLVESMVFTPEKCEALGISKSAIPNGAWWVGYRVNEGRVGDRVWDDVKNERLTAFSVHGAARRVPVGKSEGQQSATTPQAPQQAAAQSVVPSAGGVTIQTGPQQPQGKMTRKRTKKVRPNRPTNLDKAMKVLANSKG